MKKLILLLILPIVLSCAALPLLTAALPLLFNSFSSPEMQFDPNLLNEGLGKAVDGVAGAWAVNHKRGPLDLFMQIPWPKEPVDEKFIIDFLEANEFRVASNKGEDFGDFLSLANIDKLKIDVVEGQHITFSIGSPETDFMLQKDRLFFVNQLCHGEKFGYVVREEKNQGGF